MGFLMPNILRRSDVMAKTGHPTSTIYEKMSRGEFPKPVKLGSRSVGWVEEEIDDYVAKLVAKRDGSPD